MTSRWQTHPLTFGRADPREGRVIIFNFPSEDAAKNCYHDPDYLALSEFHRAGTELKFIILVHGLPPRD